jgi:hypothetical protein
MAICPFSPRNMANLGKTFRHKNPFVEVAGPLFVWCEISPEIKRCSWQSSQGSLFNFCVIENLAIISTN